jgi:hypothetical protein
MGLLLLGNLEGFCTIAVAAERWQSDIEDVFK